MQRTFAQIEFNADGTPIAKDYDDVYFSRENGEAETRYVFIDNNQLAQRWTASAARSFVIAETGFGTGLNFLTVAQAFIEWRNAHPTAPLCHLYFITTEKFPLSPQDWSTALAPFSHLALTSSLLNSHFYNSTGCQRLQFSHNDVSFTLDLWIGDAIESFKQMHVSACKTPTCIGVDAWFLDGFAPNKNEDMWQAPLFEQMARLSRPNATFATFTAAGFVKRGLQEAGFVVEKRKGFGRKRDMLAGYLDTPNDIKNSVSQHDLTPLSDNMLQSAPPHVVVVGAGIAGASLAYALARRKIKVTVICKDQDVASAASGNPQAGIYPQLHATTSQLSLIQLSCFSYARRVYDELIQQGYDFAHAWCGVLQVGFSDEVRARQDNLITTNVWPSSLVHAVTAEQATQLSGVDLPYTGLFIPDAGWAAPKEIVNALFSAAKAQTDLTILTETEYVEHTCADSTPDSISVSVSGPTPYAIQANAIVFATGHEAEKIHSLSGLPYNLTRGQVETIQCEMPLAGLKTVLCHKGYLTPSYNNTHALGSTYVKNDTNTEYRTSETEQNIAMHARSLADCPWASNIPSSLSGRAAVRCSTPDHLPIVGAAPELSVQRQQYAQVYHRYVSVPSPTVQAGTYVLTGLGSRGFTTAPLMAERLVSEMLAEPLPIGQPLLNATAPNRFLLRQIKRGEC
ncbi:bifunctional tRNA (5-methylaminomethyl-2-thiouridine)(34)-methyltransferase MnmD/FAD-dependent 5-carboxymethylaminomethyl-2-thiouridine(34) oxidoreductase MnmC [Alteromonas facilis]|uniref:bifunctional tRNA (5-methylaminomethyl-2-thiouridine)(34)-methyltransferase MnmD/FAD-dependent 5-carboxymethylaminomethyl-2-thiouridine(34) oxidoreductase MnmC n=1 Tax=Alteromonas facilis TaxID=2048004 RepID=UPI000C2879BB|nr:bifunctional tRNA (5-methylaminomethyl-2-thiouridine)(34)-methyltransferase MnmD/FAD-dependent 5-carboxymethylaminomethyl-2-thiouridine(34) oxidoreductase MnmC [Alteromonas facilis]